MNEDEKKYMKSKHLIDQRTIEQKIDATVAVLVDYFSNGNPIPVSIACEMTGISISILNQEFAKLGIFRTGKSSTRIKTNATISSIEIPSYFTTKSKIERYPELFKLIKHR